MLHVVNSKIKDALGNVVINLKVFINILKIGNLKCQCIILRVVTISSSWSSWWKDEQCELVCLIVSESGRVVQCEYVDFSSPIK